MTAFAEKMKFLGIDLGWRSSASGLCYLNPKKENWQSDI